MVRLHPVLADDDHLARVDLPDELRPDHLEGWRLGRHDPAPALDPVDDVGELTEAQRAKTVRIANGHDTGVVYEAERERSLERGQDVH